MTRFLIVPQWQGSDSARAMQLIDGAEAIAGDLPRARTTRLDVPLEAGESLDTPVRRLSALRRIAAEQCRVAAEHTDEPILTVGGDEAVATTAALLAASGQDGTVVVWIAAHAGMESAASSPSGSYESIAASALVDAETPALTELDPLEPQRLVLAGTRAVSESEQSRIRDREIRVVDADAVGAEPTAIADALRPLAPRRVFVHVAIDVLDPAAIVGVTRPEPFGVDVAALTAAIAGVREIAPLAGAALTGFAPASPAAAVDDLGTILRIIGALA